MMKIIKLPEFWKKALQLHQMFHGEIGIHGTYGVQAGVFARPKENLHGKNP